MTNSPNNRTNIAPRIFAVVLAAGSARRFGSTKQLALVNGETLVHRAARIAREVCGERSILVVGHDASAVIRSSERQCEFLLVNDQYADGIGSSIALAARSLGPNADAILLVLADQVQITAEHLRNILTTWSGDLHEVVASRFSGIECPPVLLPSGIFADLKKLRGDQGARELLRNSAFNLRTVTFEAAGVDIDTPADLERLS